MSDEALIPRNARRFSAWKVIGLVAASLALLVGALFHWLCAVGNRRFAALPQELREMVAVTESRDSSRPALRGAAVPGNAWDDYDLALRELNEIKVDRYAFGDYLSRSPKADRAKVEAHLAAHGSALDHLRRGAARSRGRFRYRWDVDESVPGLLSCQNLANMAACRARFLAEAGRPRDAAGLLLDTCQFGRDVGHNGVLLSELVGLAIDGIAFEELRDMIASGTPAPEDLVEIGRELEILDAGFPPHAFSLRNEPLYFGYAMLRSDDLKGSWFRGAARLLLMNAFDTHRDFLKRCAESEGMPWPEAREAGRKLVAEAEKIRNPIARISVQGLLQSGRAGRERLAQLRLLRTAAHFRATGEVLGLDDPFGGRLRTFVTGTKLKVWSVGRDGADHAGIGEWKPSDGKDIILEVER